MSYLKKYSLRLLYTVISILIFLLIVTVFYYNNIVSNNFYKFIKLFIILISIFTNSFLLGKDASKKGYFEGIKFGGIIIIFLLIITILTSKFQIKLFVYYFMIMMVSILGSIIGINKKRSS